MRRSWFLVPLVLVLSVASLRAQSPADPVLPGMVPGSVSADLVLGFPVSRGIFRGPFPGLHLEYDFLPGRLGIELGYAFHSLSPYLFDHQADLWSGPYPAGTSGSDDPDWPFYQTKHIVSPGIVYLWHHPTMTLKTSVGLLAQFTLASEAAEYYPDFQDRYAQAQEGVRNFLGNYWKFGADYRPWPLVSFGADFVFEVPSWGRFASEVTEDPAAYALNHSHVALRLGVNL